MTDEMRAAWIEACAKAICRQADADDGYAPSKTLDRSIEQGMWRNHAKQAEAALSVLTPLIEADVKERCAAIAEGINEYPKDEPLIDKLNLFRAGRFRAASAIRNAFPAKGEG